MALPRFNLKTIGIGLGALAAVLVVAVGLFIAFFPAELAAREAEKRIEEATGRDLTLGGDISVSFWPALGFSAEEASLSNPEGYSTDTPFISADRIVFAVKLLPLLRGSVEVKQLIFEGADVNLESRSPTEANWTFPTEASEDASETTLEDLRLDDVRLIDGLVSFKGAGDAAPLVLEDVDASLALQSLDQPADLDAAFTYRGERLNVEGQVGDPRAVLEKGETPLTAHVASNPLNANFEGGFNAETGRLAGQLDASGASLRRVMAWIGSPMENGGGFGAFRLTGELAREGDRIDLTDVSLSLDDIRADGVLALITQQNGRLSVTGALNAGQVDLNPYLPAPAQGGDQGVAVSTAWSQAPLDLSGLRAIDANLNLTLAGLRFQQLNFSNVALGLRIANGAADARLTRIGLYGGAGTARLIADGSSATPRIAVELNAQNVQAEPLLRDAIAFDKITGRGQLRASLVGRGASQAAIMRSLSGNAAFNFNDGQWKGVNLGAIARTLQAVATRSGAVSQGGDTDFSEMSATFAVSNGVAATDNLRMLLPAARMEGQGLVNIGEQTIDMRLAPRLVNSAQGQGGDAGVAGIGVPFRATGPWSHVDFRVAVEEIATNEIRDILRRQRRDGNDSPLIGLGEALFGAQPATQQPAAETPASADGAPAQQQQAQQPAQPRTREEQREDAARAIGGILGGALGGGRRQQEPAPEESK